MPDQISVEIKGLAELKKKLDELGTSAADKCVKTALKAGAEIAQQAIAERAPVRPELPSGTALPPGALASDIVVKIKKSDQGHWSAIIGPDKLTRAIARWVEYGHRLIRGGYSRVLSNGKIRGPGQLAGNVPAHPFIRPAFEETQSQVTTAITTTLATEITKAGKR